jgi:hypothetical protein
MLKAMLHHKLGRPEDDDDATGSASAWDGLTTREDPLTSAIFERFAYLQPTDAWSLLRAACVESGQAAMPEAAPAGQPVWWFWPRLSTDLGGGNTARVEPDVVVEWGDLLIVVEAKHAGTQCATQWTRQIRAVWSDPRFARKQLLFVAAGGADAGTFATISASVANELGDINVRFLLLRWAMLRHAAAALRSRLAHGSAAVLEDMIAALDAWGYQPRVGFDSLPSAAVALHITTSPADLKDWRIR